VLPPGELHCICECCRRRQRPLLVWPPTLCRRASNKDDSGLRQPRTMFQTRCCHNLPLRKNPPPWDTPWVTNFMTTCCRTYRGGFGGRQAPKLITVLDVRGWLAGHDHVTGGCCLTSVQIYLRAACWWSFFAQFRFKVLLLERLVYEPSLKQVSAAWLPCASSRIPNSPATADTARAGVLWPGERMPTVYWSVVAALS